MSRTLAAGTDNLVTATSSMPGTHWACGGWFFITAFTNAARLHHMDTGGTAGAFVRESGVLGALEAQQLCATTNAQSISSTLITLNTWTFIAATYDEAIDKKVRIYVGTLATALAEVAYATQVAGIGTATSWTDFHVGNNHAGNAGMTGQVSRPFLHLNDSGGVQLLSPLTLASLNAVKEGVYGAFFTGLVLLTDVSNVTVARNPNLINNPLVATGLTSTGCTFSEEPPVPLHLAGY